MADTQDKPTLGKAGLCAHLSAKQAAEILQGMPCLCICTLFYISLSFLSEAQSLKEQSRPSEIFPWGSWLQEGFSWIPCNIAALHESDPFLGLKTKNTKTPHLSQVWLRRHEFFLRCCKKCCPSSNCCLKRDTGKGMEVTSNGHGVLIPLF